MNRNNLLFSDPHEIYTAIVKDINRLLLAVLRRSLPNVLFPFTVFVFAGAFSAFMCGWIEAQFNTFLLDLISSLIATLVTLILTWAAFRAMERRNNGIAILHAFFELMVRVAQLRKNLPRVETGRSAYRVGLDLQRAAESAWASYTHLLNLLQSHEGIKHDVIT